MNVGRIIKKLEASKVFKEWKKDNPDYYLVHAFLMIDPKVKQAWQIGYYSKEKDRIITFDVGKEILQNPEAEVFKKEGIVNALNVDKIKLWGDKALKTAEKFAKEHYTNYKIQKRILILQNLDKTLWNITFISNTFETLNIKVSAINGMVEFHNLAKIFSFDKGLFQKKSK